MTIYEMTFSLRRLVALLNESGIVDARAPVTGYVKIVSDRREVWLEFADHLGGPWQRVTGVERKVEAAKVGQYL